MPPINLAGLYPQAYEHPDDNAALQALEHTAGLDTLIRFVSKWGMERIQRIQLTGSYLRVTPDNFPDLWRLMVTARDRLALPITPELYIKNEADLNAYTYGVDKPAVVINSGTIDLLDEHELLFVIAHELGHVKSGHVLYYQIADMLPTLGGVLGDVTFGVGSLLSTGLQIALLHWQRTSELTADRAGLLACQDTETSLKTMMKLAGLPAKYAGAANVEDFMHQAREFESFDLNKMDKIAKYLSIFDSNHPWTVMRAKELMLWIDSGGYDRVLKTHSGTGVVDGPAYCPKCGTKVAGTDAFCPKCGYPLPKRMPDPVS